MDMIKPGTFGCSVAADSRRCEFDIENEQLLYLKKKVDILFIGDSITHMWDLNAYFDTELFLVNRGIGGDVTKYIRKRFAADALQLKPDYIILMAGINDILTVHPDLWWRNPGKDRELIMTEIRENLSDIVEKCKDTRLILCSALPVGHCQPYDSDLLNGMVLEENEFIKELCQKNRLTYVDYHANLCCPDGKTMREGLTHDWIHPNGRGYEIMADALKNSLPVICKK